MRHASALLSFLVIALSSAACCKAQTRPAEASYGGTVRDQAGKPIAGALVEIIYRLPDAMGVVHRTTNTDAAGAWRASMPAEMEIVEFQVSHPKYVIEVGVRGVGVPSLDVMRQGKAVTVLRNGVPLSGVVRDESGKPVEGVLILTRYTPMTMSPSPENVPQPDTSMGITARDGSFRIEALDPGAREIATYHTQYLTTTKEVEIAAGMKPVELTVSRGGSVTGVVMSAGGKPVPLVRVSVVRPLGGGGAPTPPRATITDAEGRFKLDGLPKDKAFTLSAQGVGEFPGATVRQEPYLITQSPKTATGVLGGIMIKVLDDATGKPVTRYRLFDGPQFIAGGPAVFNEGFHFAVNSNDGTYALRGDHSKPLVGVSVRVLADGYFPAESAVVPIADAHLFELRLKPGKDVGGVVVDAGGAPVAEAQVAWVSPGRQAFVDANAKFSENYLASPEVSARTNSDGRFEIPPGMGPGALVAIHAKGYVQITATDFHDGMTIRLSPWARVEGRLVQGKMGLANARLSVYPVDSAVRSRSSPVHWMLMAATRSDGAFSFDHVPAIPLAVGVAQYAGLSPRALIEPTAGETVKVQIGGGGREVSGTLKAPSDLDIKPARGGRTLISLTLRPTSDSDEHFDQVRDEADPRRVFYSATVAEGGRFTFHDVPVGEYVLRATVLVPPVDDPRGRLVPKAMGSMPVVVSEGEGAVEVGEVRMRESGGR